MMETQRELLSSEMSVEEAHRLLMELLVKESSDRYAKLPHAIKTAIRHECLYRVGVPISVIGRSFEERNKKLERDLFNMTLPGQKCQSVWISGPVGVGKTSHLSSMLLALCHYWGERCDYFGRFLPSLFTSHCIFTHYGSLVDKVFEMVKGEGEGLRGIQEMKAIPLLIIDDLLAIHSSEFVLSTVEGIIEARYSNHLPTWISTNISGPDLMKYPGFERASSRMADQDWMRYFQVVGNDRRKE